MLELRAGVHEHDCLQENGKPRFVIVSVNENLYSSMCELIRFSLISFDVIELLELSENDADGNASFTQRLVARVDPIGVSCRPTIVAVVRFSA